MKDDGKNDYYKGMLLATLACHIGVHHAIGMAELFEEVYGDAWSHRINDTRRLRALITKMRRDGVPIGSIALKDGGGYYLMMAGSEMEDYLRRNERRALRILARNAAVKRVSLPDYIGQMRLNMEAENGKSE